MATPAQATERKNAETSWRWRRRRSWRRCWRRCWLPVLVLVVASTSAIWSPPVFSIVVVFHAVLAQLCSAMGAAADRGVVTPLALGIVPDQARLR